MKDNILYQTNNSDCHIDHCPFRENNTSSATYCARQSCLNRAPIPQTSKTTMLIRNAGLCVGDKAFYSNGDFIEEVNVLDFFTDNGRIFAKVRFLAIGGMCTVPVDHLHKSHEECRRVNRSISDRKRDDFMSQITSIRDLLVFALNHDLTISEYGDADARAAFLQRTFELMGIDLEMEEK